MKFIFATLLFVSLVLSSSFVQLSFAKPVVLPLSTLDGPPPQRKLLGFCDSKCGERCAKAGVKDWCLKYCGICCRECNCVPSGTYGNKSECPCYRDRLNSKGQPKCPWTPHQIHPNPSPVSYYI
ncbi:snakin-1-like [Durio zibethinus]|uniref:Snakin-1-like n=1 Tax=Durio zibethinus TaxID=66656 RepID=A0A6P5ZI92_DURZI|nr:snakin-1-like [Durio zibethinus]